MLSGLDLMDGRTQVDAPWTPKSFVGKTPQELVEEVPPIPVNGARVACDGGPNPGMPALTPELQTPNPPPQPWCARPVTRPSRPTPLRIFGAMRRVALWYLETRRLHDSRGT